MLLPLISSATQTQSKTTQDVGVQCELLRPTAPLPLHVQSSALENEPLAPSTQPSSHTFEPLASSSPKAVYYPSSESEDEIKDPEGDITFVLSQDSRYVTLLYLLL